MVVFVEGGGVRGQSKQGKTGVSFHCSALLARVAPQTFHARVIFHLPGFRSEFFPGLRENKVASITQHLSHPTQA